MYIAKQKNKYYLRQSKWDKEKQKITAFAIYLGATAAAAKKKLLSLDQLSNKSKNELLKKIPNELDAEEIINRQINYLKSQIGEYHNINKILNKTIKELQELKELHIDRLRETTDCWDCQHNPNHSNTCLKYDTVYTGDRAGRGLCPSYQPKCSK